MSMSDWTDYQRGANMILSAAQHHEGAKSLRILGLENGTVDELIKILDASEIDLPGAANFDFWAYFISGADNTGMGLFFRYQNTENFYCVNFFHSHGGAPNLSTIFRKRVASTYTSSAAGFGNLGDFESEWVHLKVLLCEVANIVYCLVYQEINSAWVLKKESTLSKEWANGALGVGFTPVGYIIGATSYVYLDDLKIYYT